MLPFEEKDFEKIKRTTNVIFPRIVQSGFFLVGARNEAKSKEVFIYQPTQSQMSITLEEKTNRGKKKSLCGT